MSISKAREPSAPPKQLWFKYRSEEAWLQLYDPTLISDRLESELSYEEDAPSRAILKLENSLRQAFPIREDLAFGYQLGLPVESFEDGLENVSGLGDLNFKVGYVGRFSPTLRWGLGLRAAFDTASAPVLGDDVFQLRQITAIRWNASDSIVLGFNLEYSFTPLEEANSDINALELNFPVTVKINDLLSASLEYKPKWNFETGDDRHRLSLTGSRLFGSEHQYAYSLGGEVPMTAESFDWKLLTKVSWFF